MYTHKTTTHYSSLILLCYFFLQLKWKRQNKIGFDWKRPIFKLILFLWITSQKPTFRLTIKFYIELKEVTTKWCTYRQQSSQIFSYIWKSNPQVKHIKQVHQVFPGEHISHVYTLWFLYCCDCSIVRIFFWCRRVTLRIKNKAVSQTVYTKLGQKVTTFFTTKKIKNINAPNFGQQLDAEYNY